MYPLAGKPLSPSPGRTATKLHLAILPDYLYLGLSALAQTSKAAEKAVRLLYYKARKQSHGEEFQNMTWEEAKEGFGFHVNEVEVGKAYFSEEPGA